MSVEEVLLAELQGIGFEVGDCQDVLPSCITMRDFHQPPQLTPLLLCWHRWTPTGVLPVLGPCIPWLFSGASICGSVLWTRRHDQLKLWLCHGQHTDV